MTGTTQEDKKLDGNLKQARPEASHEAGHFLGVLAKCTSAIAKNMLIIERPLLHSQRSNVPVAEFNEKLSFSVQPSTCVHVSSQIDGHVCMRVYTKFHTQVPTAAN